MPSEPNFIEEMHRLEASTMAATMQIGQRQRLNNRGNVDVSDVAADVGAD
jgi:hypothetical protein